MTFHSLWGSSLTYRIQAFNVISFGAEVVQCGPNDSGCCCGWFVQGAGEATDHGLLAKKGCSLNRGEWVNEMDKQRSWETHNLNKYVCIYYIHLPLSLSLYIYMHTYIHVVYVYLYTYQIVEALKAWFLKGHERRGADHGYTVKVRGCDVWVRWVRWWVRWMRWLVQWWVRWVRCVGTMGAVVGALVSAMGGLVDIYIYNDIYIYI